VKLNLGSNKLSAIPRFGSAGMREITLANNLITDIGNLAGMPQLSNVGLRGNRVADAGALASDGALTTVDLRGNRIDLNNFGGVDRVLDKSYLGDNPICASLAIDNPRVRAACSRIPFRFIDRCVLVGCIRLPAITDHAIFHQ
jgi:internalin A